MIEVVVRYRDGSWPRQHTFDIRGTCGNHAAAIAAAIAMVAVLVPGAIIESHTSRKIAA